MPSRSKSQERFFAGVASGNIKKPGLSKEKAMEFVGPAAGLPERVKPKPKGKTK